MKRWVWIGVDLGQRRDYSAIAVVERFWEQSTFNDFLRSGLDGQWWFRVRMLERIRRMTPYPEVVRRVREISDMPMIAMGRTVVVDGTGVGAPVVDLLRRGGWGCQIVPVLITGGGRASMGLRGGYESVSRSELLTGMQVLVQQGRLKVASRSREAEVLRKEMLEVRLNSSDSGGAGHDDMVIAVALALWKARVGISVELVRR